MTAVRVTVAKGPHATVRAIERSGVATPASAGIVAETEWTYTYEIEGPEVDTTLETVRELHVLYGIAMTSRLTEPEPAISDVYAWLAADIHTTLRWITAGEPVGRHLCWLTAKWSDTANHLIPDAPIAALYGSWAQNIKSIT